MISYGKIAILTPKEIKKIRKVDHNLREISEITASHIMEGITTDELDAILHKECIKRASQLNYYNFSKSVCTSVNEIIRHGIIDKRPFKNGDIVNM